VGGGVVGDNPPLCGPEPTVGELVGAARVSSSGAAVALWAGWSESSAQWAFRARDVAYLLLVGSGPIGPSARTPRGHRAVMRVLLAAYRGAIARSCAAAVRRVDRTAHESQP